MQKDVTTCDLECPTGYVKGTDSSADNLGNICLKCNPCLTCQNNPSECISCPDTLFLDSISKTCNSSCSINSGTWPNMITHTCDLCHSSCTKCYGSGTTKCKSCLYPNYNLNLLTDSCVEICPDGYYPN